MSIIIKRKTGWLGKFVNISIKINGEKIAKIANDESLHLDITEKHPLLRVSQFGIRSNELKVANGDVIEVKTARLSYMIVFLLFFTLFLSSLNLHPAYEIVLITAIITLYILSMFILNGFQLKRMDDKG